jgi:hypothetical protein
MPSESFKRYHFGQAEPQALRDWSGINGQLVYEGYASPGLGTDKPGWVIIKHSFDGNGNDSQSQPLSGKVWDLRTFYDFS